MNQASAPGLRIVHSSVGRLRVHLPDPNGHLAASLRGLPGVTYAEASNLTGNILILFNPEQTSEESLTAFLQNLEEGTPAPLPVAVPEMVSTPQMVTPTILQDDPLPPDTTVYVTGIQRRLYHIFGWSSIGMAVVGAILPGIPTVPFVILASYFFIRSSPEAHRWLLRSRWFGPILRDWEERRGVKRSVKYTAVSLMAAGLVITWLIGLPVAVLAVILALEIIGLTVVLSLPVIEPSELPLELAPQGS